MPIRTLGTIDDALALVRAWVDPEGGAYYNSRNTLSVVIRGLTRRCNDNSNGFWTGVGGVLIPTEAFRPLLEIFLMIQELAPNISSLLACEIVEDAFLEVKNSDKESQEIAVCGDAGTG